MQNTMIDQLASEVMQLKRENRWIKGLLAAIAVCLVAICSLGAMRLQDTEIRLVDPKTGIVRFSVATDPVSGASGIQIHDANGRKRIVFGTLPEPGEPAGLLLLDPAGTVTKDFRQ